MLNFLSELILGRSPIPEPFKRCSYSSLPLISIDLELTDLNINRAKVTSIGWIQGKMFDVDLSSAHYDIVRASGDLHQSPVIHGLGAKEIAKGTHIREHVEALKAFVESHVWVFHNATLDVKMLSRLWRLLEFESVSITTIDTMLLQVYVLEKTQGYVPSGGVTLASCRSYYHLSHAPEHNALDDALATLTLLYAQLHQLDKTTNASLQQLSHTRAVKTFTLG